MKIDDAICSDKYEKLYNFVHLISTDYVELSHEKVRVQRDEYMRRARKLIQELHNDDYIIKKKDAEIVRLKAHLASASCPHGCLSGDAGKYLSDGSFSKCDWCAARKSYIKEQGE